eukprot:CAMPEP_0113327788 /NCGR_PEP_ID=MMETSP0010_2-20120614/19547_1 /TAXON_ID=216773 ORGANISM="Corethron hystrix, Strain 308" /NCGR_SAMPLE_ID=MMETSP0010_2 /ASSEMBLY_ACC=CAM_ASM_000155 /LENGTH=106 /DNA_ID=CAMNT_0000188821 /DNA_START=94 /DNA_END=411 /DNA_ORIENTATION=+ /assembly_acc=CAM_ASM_000155
MAVAPETPPPPCSSLVSCKMDPSHVHVVKVDGSFVSRPVPPSQDSATTVAAIGPAVTTSLYSSSCCVCETTASTPTASPWSCEWLGPQLSTTWGEDVSQPPPGESG